MENTSLQQNHLDVPRNVLITGCASGIGRAVALGLKQRGHRVFATVRNPKDVEALEAERIETHHLDLRDAESMDATLDWVLTRTGGTLDALFNNGAYAQIGAVEDLPVAALREQFETNLFGTHELTRRVIPIMRRQGFGRIIQNSSVLGFVAMPYRGAYVASKFALEGLTHALRLELQGSGIHVALIQPGPILSRFRLNSLPYFERYIDLAASPHREVYQGVAERLRTDGAVTRFTKPPEAIIKHVAHALESPNPKACYPVTFPTHLFGWLLRILSRRAMDRILRMANKA
ncbi:MAG: SDR family NAD(P)-dependent oxidoreductase [Magnetococcus sp. DMHC-1]|nr:SDR family NAD(P)-dependent oxidoreductase [Magnetococcales bacterium]